MVVFMSESTESSDKQTCPKCGLVDVASVEYGLPDWDLLAERLKQPNHGRFVLGGCCYGPGSPAFCCLACRNWFGDYYELEKVRGLAERVSGIPEPYIDFEKANKDAELILAEARRTGYESSPQ